MDELYCMLARSATDAMGSCLGVFMRLLLFRSLSRPQPTDAVAAAHPIL
jgi:hypothetical protein